MSEDNNEKALEEETPHTGRVIKEDATVINVADAIVSDGNGGIAINAISIT